MNRVNLRIVLRAIVWIMVLGASSELLGQGEYFDHTTGIRGTRMWLPSGVTTVKGIVIYGNGAGADMRRAAEAPWLQQFADLHDFALIGTSLWGNLSGAEIDVWDDHLEALAAASDHPELVHAPWAPMGFSNGGQMSYGFNALRPEKTIAFITNKGCCYNNRTPPAASLKTPGILIAGELDSATRRDSIRGLFETNRSRGALWSWVEQEGLAHEGFADEMVLPFMAEAIRLRYPTDQVPTAIQGVTLRPVNEVDGWLVDQSTWNSGLTQIASYDNYTGNKQTAGWLLNENVAHLYRAFSTYDRPVNLEFSDPWTWEEVGYTPPALSLTEHTPATLQLTLDVSAMPSWTKIELFNYAEPVLTLTSSPSLPTELEFDLPIFGRGIFSYSALVTAADRQTVRTTNLLTYLAVPEPTTAATFIVVVMLALFPSRACGTSIQRTGPSAAPWRGFIAGLMPSRSQRFPSGARLRQASGERTHPHSLNWLTC
jgi:dienelactone hydrolase